MAAQSPLLMLLFGAALLMLCVSPISCDPLRTEDGALGGSRRRLAQATPPPPPPSTGEENVNVIPENGADDHDELLVYFNTAQNPKTIVEQFQTTLAENNATQNLTIAGNITTKVDDGTASSWGNTDNGGVQGLVFDLGGTADLEAAKAALEAATADLVPAGAFVMPNYRTYAAAGIRQAACQAPSIVSQGQVGSMTASNWNKNCVNGRNTIKWYGRRCGDDLSKVEYTHIIAFSQGDVIASDPKNTQGNYRGLCVLTKSDPGQSPAARNRRFGSGCGNPPPLNFATKSFASCVDDTLASAKCATLVKAAGASKTAQGVTQTIYTSQSLTCPNGRWLPAGTQLTLSGTTCGPTNEHINWQMADDGQGCTFFSSNIGGRDLPRTASVLGLGCGSAAPSQVCPAPPQPTCQDTPYKHIDAKPPSEAAEVPMGVRRIYRNCLPAVAGLKDNEQVVVAIADSGVHRHDNLNIYNIPGFGTGKNMGVTASDKYPLDEDPNYDYYGHGTHVAGIVGGKGPDPNQPASSSVKPTVGVSPNARIISLKVFDGAGDGKMSWMQKAAAWLASEGPDLGVKVAVFSLVLPLPSNLSPELFEGSKNVICAPFKDASDRGIIIVAAAGNQKSSMHNYFPAACPTVLAATGLNTAMDGPGVAYSNYLDRTMATPDDMQTTMAAPGCNITSTVPTHIKPEGYMTLCGTSQAAPHIAGVAANCFMSKECDARRTGRDNIDTIRQAAEWRARQADGVMYKPYGFTGDPATPLGNTYYGSLTWSAF